MNLHDIKDVGELLGLVIMTWRVITAVNRMTSVLRDYPPHRHESGGVVSYPYDYPPAPAGRLNGGGK